MIIPVASGIRVTEALFVASQNMLPSHEVHLLGPSASPLRRIALAGLPRRRLRGSAAYARFRSPALHPGVSMGNIICEAIRRLDGTGRAKEVGLGWCA